MSVASSSKMKMKYAPLRLESPELDKLMGNGNDSSPLSTDKGSTRHTSLKWNILATWAIVLCTVFNFAILFQSPAIKDKVDNTPLKRPDQYIGLDKLSYNRSSLKGEQLSLTTFPTIIHQIDSTQPDAVVPSSAKLEYTVFGTIAPETRLFLATSEISTVVQFRARDYAMEHCKLILSLPGGMELPKSPLESISLNGLGQSKLERGWHLAGDTTKLEIWILDATNWLDTAKLSYSNRPRRLNRIGSYIVRPGKTIETHGFPCPTDSIQSFELFCIGVGCKVEVVQNKREPILGLVLNQHSSL